MKKFILFLLSLLFFNTAFALPTQVIIIRHGEKPLKGKDLDAKGYERAAALPYYLKKFNIAAIYAMGLNQDKESSRRPIETCEPTAKSLGLPIHTEYTRKQYPQLAEEIKNNPEYNNKIILICWEHHVIPPMAKSFGVINGPKDWPDNVFDAVWIINFVNKQPELKIDSQQLLYGDFLNTEQKFTQ